MVGGRKESLFILEGGGKEFITPLRKRIWRLARGRGGCTKGKKKKYPLLLCKGSILRKKGERRRLL